MDIPSNNLVQTSISRTGLSERISPADTSANTSAEAWLGSKSTPAGNPTLGVNPSPEYRSMAPVDIAADIAKHLI